MLLVTSVRGLNTSDCPVLSDPGTRHDLISSEGTEASARLFCPAYSLSDYPWMCLSGFIILHPIPSGSHLHQRFNLVGKGQGSRNSLCCAGAFL